MGGRVRVRVRGRVRGKVRGRVGGGEAHRPVIDHKVGGQSVVGVEALSEAVAEERDADDGKGQHHKEGHEDEGGHLGYGEEQRIDHGEHRLDPVEEGEHAHALRELIDAVRARPLVRLRADEHEEGLQYDDGHG